MQLMSAPLIERTVSTTNTSKFGQSICAFVNDLTDHRKSGYLIPGADNDGYITLQGARKSGERIILKKFRHVLLTLLCRLTAHHAANFACESHIDLPCNL